MRCRYGIAVISILLALIAWVLAAAVALLDGRDASFMELLITDVPRHALILRLLIVALFLGLGLVGSMLCGALERAAGSRRALMQMMDAAPTGMLLVAPGLEVVHANKAMSRLLGLPVEQIVGSTCDKLTPSDFCGTERCAVRRVTEGQEPHTREAPIVRPDGGTTTCLISSSAVHGPGGRVEAVLESFHDISERKQMEQALAESEQRYRSLVENARIGILIVQDGLVRYANQHAAESIGYSAQDMIDTHISRYLAGESLESMAQAHGRRMELAARGEPVPPLADEATVISSSGVHMEVEISGAVVSHEGRPADLVAIRDITETKRAERALAAEKERLQVTLRSLGEGVITTSMDGRVTLLNRAAEQLLGWTQADALGRELSEVCPLRDEDSADPLPDPLERALGHSVVGNSTETALLVARDGIARTVATAAAPLYDPDSQMVGAVLVLRDITAERRQADQRRRIETLEAVGLLAGGIAHDFNNLLMGFFGNISLARLAMETDDDVMERLNAAERGLDRARELTGRLLTFSSGGKPMRSRISLDNLLAEAVEMALDGEAERCRLHIAEDLWAIEADGGQLKQVIAHLVRNADEATNGDGQVLLAAENVVLQDDDLVPLPPGEYVHMSVSDSGPGISREVMPRLFEPYFTTKSTHRGLGLPVAFSVVRQHEGHIEVESQPGHGTVMHVYLPVAEPQAGSHARAQAEPRVAGSGPHRILVMDDDELVRSALGAVLKQLGHEVDLAADGAEALALYDEAMGVDRPYAVVIMDLTIPGGMGGKEAVGRLRRLDPQARVIVSSGYSTDPIMGDYAAYGFDGVIAKPYRLEELKQVLEPLLGDG